MLPFFKRTDIYFAADDSHRFLPWLMGIMVFLATLLLCLGISVSSWVVEHHSSYADTFTVNIPAATENLDEKIEKISAVLKDARGVGAISRMPESEVKGLLSTWLGDSDAIDDLPLPAVLEVAVTQDNTQKIDYTALQKRLAAIVPGVEVDAHELWVAAFASFSGAVQSLMVILAVLIILCMAMMIAFTSRAALKLHAKTVQLLHSIGAEDGYISRQFQMEAFRLVLPGALGGCVIAGACYLFAGKYIASLQTSIMPSLDLTPAHYALLVAMPAACTLVAWTVARLSVIRQLESSL